MITCQLAILMAKKKLKISDVARETGINRGTLTRLYQETAQRIDFDIMNTLCQFFDCTPGELFMQE